MSQPTQTPWHLEKNIHGTFIMSDKFIVARIMDAHTEEQQKAAQAMTVALELLAYAEMQDQYYSWINHEGGNPPDPFSKMKDNGWDEKTEHPSDFFNRFRKQTIAKAEVR